MRSDHIRASLRVWHPTMPAQAIYQSIKLKLVRQWSYGEPRTTPKGNALEGTHTETYCCFELDQSHSQELPSTLRLANEELSHSAELIKEIANSGGRIEYYITLSGGMGFELDSALVSELSALNASLAVEVL